MNKKAKMSGLEIFGIVAIALVAIAVVANYAGIDLGAITGGKTTSGDEPTNLDVQCEQNPSYSYSAYDAFTSTAFTGTTYIKLDGNKPVTSLASPTAGKSIDYWMKNVTKFCELISGTVDCGANTLQATCYSNGTVTVKVFDIGSNVFLTQNGGANNLTMGANANANIRIDYQGSAKYSSMPFGGCMAVEVPSGVTDVTLNGEGVKSGCPYQWTYTVQSTSNTYKMFTIPAGFDKDGLGDIKQISGQIKSGSTNPSGLAYVTLMPANYYVGDDGNFYMDIEKAKNSDTTKTFGQLIQYAVKIQ